MDFTPPQGYHYDALTMDDIVPPAKQAEKTHFSGGGCRVSIPTGFRLICPTALHELSLIYEEGERKYPFNNEGDIPNTPGSTWLRGLPFGDTIEHLQNHLQIAMMGGNEEGGPITHLAKVAWGCFTSIHFMKNCKHHRSALMNEMQTRHGWDGGYGRKTTK
jgi:hypothetical protein